MKNNRTPLAPQSASFTSPLAQLANPVQWQCSIIEQFATGYLLTFEAIIAPDWHLYSQSTAKGGPAPLQIQYPDHKGHFHPVGNTFESATITEYSEIFGVNETFFLDKAKIQQAIKISDPSIPQLSIALSYQICKEVCIPQRVNFEFDTITLKAKVTDQ